MRFRLVPKRHRRKIVAASIGMAMFNRHPNLLFEDNRILDGKTVDGHRVSPILAATGDDAMIGSVIDLGRAPGAVEVVFGSCSMQCRWPGIISSRHGFRPRSDAGSGGLTWDV